MYYVLSYANENLIFHIGMIYKLLFKTILPSS